MILNTERLILRPYKVEDYDRVHAYGSVAEVSQYDVWGPNTEDDTRNFINDKIEKASKSPRYEFEFAVCIKESGLLIGGCGIRRESQTSRVANLGYIINPELQKKGYATEATRKLIDFGFKELDLKIIYATCDTRNTASYKVMERCRMKKVGLIEKHKKIRGEMRDMYRYEIYN